MVCKTHGKRLVGAHVSVFPLFCLRSWCSRVFSFIVFFLLTELPLASFQVGLLVSDSFSFPLSHMALFPFYSRRMIWLDRELTVDSFSVSTWKMCYPFRQSPWIWWESVIPTEVFPQVMPHSSLALCKMSYWPLVFGSLNCRVFVWISSDSPSSWFTRLLESAGMCL